MKKPKQPKPPFKAEGMTVQEIIDLGDDEISRMNARDLSRALRTVSLAANKRIRRLEKKAEKHVNDFGDVQYVDVSGQGIDFESLYAVGERKFGLGKGKHDRGDIYKEFARVRNFMNSKSTTISGAIELRKKRERQLFGKTSEEMFEGVSAAERDLMQANMKDMMSDIYSEYHRWREEYAIEGGYTKEKGRRVLKMFGRRVMDKGMSPEDARQDISDYYDLEYERKERKRKKYEE